MDSIDSREKSSHQSGRSYGLVQEMLDEHYKICHSYSRLVNSVITQNSSEFRRELQVFKALLTSHFLREAVHLYVHLRHELRADPKWCGLTTAYKNEMDEIGAEVIGFIDQYLAVPMEEIDFDLILRQLTNVGVLLGDRIRREEVELYPLYNGLESNGEKNAMR